VLAPRPRCGDEIASSLASPLGKTLLMKSHGIDAQRGILRKGRCLPSKFGVNRGGPTDQSATEPPNGPNKQQWPFPAFPQSAPQTNPCPSPAHPRPNGPPTRKKCRDLPPVPRPALQRRTAGSRPIEPAPPLPPHQQSPTGAPRRNKQQYAPAETRGPETDAKPHSPYFRLPNPVLTAPPQGDYPPCPPPLHHSCPQTVAAAPSCKAARPPGARCAQPRTFT